MEIQVCYGRLRLPRSDHNISDLDSPLGQHYYVHPLQKQRSSHIVITISIGMLFCLLHFSSEALSISLLFFLCLVVGLQHRQFFLKNPRLFSIQSRIKSMINLIE